MVSRKFYFSGVWCLLAILLSVQSVSSQNINNYSFSTSVTGSLALDRNGNTVNMSTGTTQLVGPSVDDTPTPALSVNSMGFDFVFMNALYTQFSANSNGSVRLGGTVISNTTYSIAQTGQAILSAMAGDLETSSSGKVHYKLVGTSPNRCLVIEFLNMGLDYTGGFTNTDGTYQVRLYETSGIVEFVYGAMFRNSTAVNSAMNVGINSNNTATTLLSVNTATNATQNTLFTNTYTTSAVMPNLNSAVDGSRTVYTFTPFIPAAPTSLTFAPVAATGMTVNWVDNSTNELSFYVYRSTDNINFTYLGNVASSTSAGTGTGYNLPQSGLTPGTLYYYKVYAVSEGGFSVPLTGSQSTLVGSLCGVKTVGPTGNYISLTSAFADLAANSLSCPVVLELQAAYVSTVETFPLVVPYMATTAANTVTVRPELGATNLSITSAAAQTISYSAALQSSYVTFDGRPGGLGINRELTLENTSTTGVAVQFTNDAHHNGLNYVKVRGQNTSTTSGVVVFGNGVTSLGNSNNIISNAEIFRTASAQPTNLVYSNNGTAGSTNTSNTITNSLLHDNFNAASLNTGVLLGTGNSTWTITSNSFYQSATQTFTSGSIHGSITVNSGSGYTITGNYIGGTAANCGGTAWTMTGSSTRFQAITFAGGTTVASEIQSNTIQNMNVTTTSGSSSVWVGIGITSGNVNVGTVATPNIIGNTTSTGSIVITTSTTGGGVIGINSTSSGIVNIRGNQIGAITANGGAALSTSIIGIQTNAGTTTIANNMIGSSSVSGSLVNAASTNSTAGNITGILSSASGTTVINANTMGSFTNQYIGTGTGQTRGIVTTSGTNTITGNTIGGIGGAVSQTGTGTSAGVIGIYQTSTTAPQTITGNIISGLLNTITTGSVMVTGIEYSGPSSGTNLISQNQIVGLGAPLNTGSPIVNGIRIDGGVATYANNMILLGVDPTGTSYTRSHEYNGIYKNTTANNNIYFNTVSIAGTGVGAGTLNTYAFRRSSTGTDIVRNNIFSNTRSNGVSTGSHYSIFLNANTSITSNNNDLFGNGTGYVLGNSSATNYATLALWQAGVSQDAASISILPPFVSATDLHINGSDPTSASLDGTAFNGSGITIDYDGTTRAATPDIGADEFVGPSCSSANGGTITPATVSKCSGQTVSLTSTGASAGTGITYQWMVSTTSGSGYVNVTGGTGATTTSYTSAALTPGIYYYVLKATCSSGPVSANSNEVTVTVNALPTVTVSPTSSTICQPGGSAVAVTASGASTYTWSPTTGLTPATGSNVSALPASTTVYTVTGTDVNTCSNTATVTISLASQPSAPVVNPSSVSLCSGGSVNLTSSSTIDVTQGAGALTTTLNATASSDYPNPIHHYYGGTKHQMLLLPSELTALGLSAGSVISSLSFYVVSVDHHDPLAAYQVKMGLSSLTSLTSFQTGLSFVYGPTTYTTVAGKNTLPFSSNFTWDGTSSIIIETSYSNADAPSVGNVTLAYDNTAFNSTLVYRVDNTAAATVAAFTGTPSYILTSRPKMSFTTTYYNMVWTPSTYLNNPNISNPVASNVLSSITYTVTATNGACTATNTVAVTAGSPLTSGALTSNSPICQGSNLTVTASPSGGGIPYTYSWTVDGGSPFTSPTATATIPGLTPGTHTIVSTVTDNCSATTSQSISVTVNATPTATASTTSPLCIGNTINLTGTTDIGTSFSWTGPNSFTSTLQNPSITGATQAMGGVYSFTATLGTCTSPASTVTLVVNPNPSGVTSTATPSTLCVGATTNLTSTGSTPGAVLLTENFNGAATGWTTTNNSTGGTPALAAWTLRPNSYVYSFTTFNSNDNSQFYMSNSDAQGSSSTTNTTLQSPSFSTLGMATLSLDFYHYFRYNASPDSGIVEVSTNGGTSWNIVQTYTATTGAATAFAHPTLSLNSYVNNASVIVRFRYKSPFGYYWAIDNVTVTGATASTFAWTSAPAGFTSSLQNPTNVAPTTSTVYTVTASNSFGCTATSSVSVTVNPLPTVGINATPNDTVCAGTSVTLSGTGATSYTWTGGVTNGVAFVPGATASYTVTGTNSNSCTNTATINLVVNTVPTVSFTALPNDSVCSGGNVTLSGTGAASYSWTGGVTNGVAFAPAATSTYTVTGTSAQGCTNTATATISVINNPTVGFTSLPNDSVCAGGSVTLSGTGATSYTWTGGVTNGVAFTPGSTATYTVTGTNTFGCTNTASATVTVVPLPTVGINTTPSSTVCTGTNVTLSGTGANSYTWTGGISDGVAFPATSTQTYTVTGTNTFGCTNTNSTTINVNPLPTVGITAAPNDTICIGATVTLNGTGATSYTWTGGVTDGVAFTPAGTTTYTVTGTNSNGCTNTSTVTVVVQSLPVVSFTSLPNDSICNGNTVTLSGTGAASYTWTGGVTNGVAFTPAGTGTYTVTGTNAGGCTATATATVTVIARPTVNFTASPAGAVCTGTNVTLSGTGANTYTWTGGISNGVAFPATSTQTYTVTGTNTFGCTNTASATVTVNPLPTVGITASPNDTICIGATVTLNGTGATSYTWTGGVTNGVAFTPAGTTTYTVTGTNSNSCTNTSTITVVVQSLPVVSFTASPNDSICAGSSVTLSGTGSNSYSWTGGITNGVAFTPAATGTYTVTGTNTGGCTGTSVATITVVPLPTVGATSVPNSPVCSNTNVTLSGTGASTYTWTGGVTNGVAFPAVSTTTYTVTGTTAFGCSATATQTVTVNPLPTVGFTVASNDTVCTGGSVTLSGTGATSYTWTGSVTNGVAFTPAASGTYTVTGTDANTCSNTAVATITVNPLPTVGYTVAANDTVCPGGSVTLSGTGAASYSWNNGISDGVAFNPASSGSYTVTGTDAFGCSNTAVAPIVVGTNPSVNLGADIVQPNPPAVLDAGAGFSSYLWSTSATTQTISVNTNGTYIVTVTNNFGCTDSDTIDVFFTSGVLNPDGTPTTVSLYPNPTKGPFNVRIDNLETSNLTVDILDMTGKVVYTRYVGSVSGNTIEAFDMTELRMGAYVLRVTANGQSKQLRFIINQ